MARSAPIDRDRIRSAWQGRISGCQLGKPVELLSMMSGYDELHSYLERAEALPLRDYVPLIEDTMVAQIGRKSCKGQLTRSEPDDDITYSVLALMMLEEHGAKLDTPDVARAWLRLLPAGATFTAERAAYRVLAREADEMFIFGGPASFDLTACSDHEWSDWIGAQIRADVYGWVCPGAPQRAAELARRDASLSHRDDGVHGAMFVAALGAAAAAAPSIEAAIDEALGTIPSSSGAAEAVAAGRAAAGSETGLTDLHSKYEGMSPVHTLNNLALVVRSLLVGADDFSIAIGDAVAGGWDTDCNGATVGGIWGVTGRPIPTHWTEPWKGRIAVTIAGVGELSLDDLVERTAVVAERIAQEA